MAGFELLKGVRDLGSIPDDYRPKKWRPNQIERDNTEHPVDAKYTEHLIDEDAIEHTVEEDDTGNSAANELRQDDDSPRPLNSAAVDLRKLEEDPGRCPLDEIADALRTLTYGEMLELAESMWKANAEGSNLTESGLPAVLHRWSASRQL